jgi:glyoxylase-like metal-dependent hydrolase (beta-lactamase superfamily II)
MTSILRADVHVSNRLPMAIKRRGESSAFSPISCTLIHGDREAVLVDTPISISQAETLIQWIENIMPNKELKYTYITHGHGDHWFGIPVLKKRWPNLKAIATKATVEQMKLQLAPERYEGLWLQLFPGGQIYEPQELAQPMEKDTFEIEGHILRAIQVGHTDTNDTTVLHVPDLDLVVAGDAVYGDVHQFFGEADTTAKRKEWLRAIETIKSLKPHTVIAGHKRDGSVDGIYNLEATKEYIHAFEKATKTCNSSEELYQKMKQLYPNRINPHAIMSGANSAFKDEAFE